MKLLMLEYNPPSSYFLRLKTKKTNKLIGLSPRANYRPSYSRLSTKLMQTFADRGCRVVIATDPHGRNLSF
jgi:hypothetical protein